MLDSLGLEPLETRRKLSGQCMMYKTIHGLVGLRRKHEHGTVMRIHSRRPLDLRMPLNSPFPRGTQENGTSSQPTPSQGSGVSIASGVQEESDYLSYELQSKIDKSIIGIFFLIMYFLVVSVMPHRLYYNLMKVKVKIKLSGPCDLFWLF